MKHIKKFNENFITSAISKASELLNYSKEADAISKRYIKMVYDDWYKRKDFYRISIIESDGYTTLKYLISDDEHVDAKSGNRSKGDIDVEFSYINNTLSWSNDKTKARLEVSKFIPYKGSLILVGREIKTNKIINSEEGVNDDLISYLNVPSGDVLKLIKFLIGEFKKKYPKMSKYYCKDQVLQQDPSLRKKEMQDSERRRNKEREDYEAKAKAESEKAISIVRTLKVDEEDIEDYLLEIKDELKTSIDISPVVYMNDNIFAEWSKKSRLTGFYKSFSTEHIGNIIPLEKDKAYHMVTIKLHEDNFEEFKNMTNRVMKRVCHAETGLKKLAARRRV
jgi:hypothetical protein